MSLVRASVALLSLLSLAACSAAPESSPKGSTGVTPKSGAAGTSANGDAPDSGEAGGAQAVTQSGTIVDFSTKAAVVGATVTAAGQTATTGADGSYALTFQKGEPFALSVSTPGYATLLEQQTSLQADYAAGTTSLVPDTLASFLTASLTGYEAALGVLSLEVIPTGACASEDGAIVSVSPAGSAQIAYFSGSLPSGALTAVKGGNFPSAVIYNVAPGVPLTVTVTHPTCTEAAFPFVQDGVEYTGGISTEAGDVTGFARIFLQ